MEWIQENIVTVLILLVVLWLVWARVVRPKMLGIKKMTAGAYPDFDENHTLVDVRSRSEWNNGHPANAIHIALNEFEQKMGSLPKDKPLILICASGMRSSMAATMAAKAGHKDVYNFAGGFGSWCAAQLPRK
ncbi:MAG: rhodanese-like domain-containing protein [Ghiorsea sp.]|nr:rhodanese-like domain-containing protein [Ghiorsea sp.]